MADTNDSLSAPSGPGSNSRPIEDYGLIGNLHTVALVSRAGSIDWFCPGRFDQSACFAALLGSAEHGCWSLAPTGETLHLTRAYLADTLLLKTTFTTATGELELLDYMPVQWDCHLVRQVRCTRGEVQVSTLCRPRFDYGRCAAEVQAENAGHLWMSHGDQRLRLLSDVTLAAADGAASAGFTLTAGQTRYFVLSSGDFDGDFAIPEEVAEITDRCAAWWRNWVAQCSYKGPWRDAVVRSLITLKALIYAPTGALVAAATTSLSEVPGGIANWDYRYSWPRDAALVFDVLLRSGFELEEEEWRDWLVNAVEQSGGELRPIYAVDGQPCARERILDWLPGYEDARPVRVGNAAGGQHQLDLLGEVIDMLHLVRKEGQGIKPEMWELQCRLLGKLAQTWREPDTGIWESRDKPRHYVHSKVFAWAAFARSVYDAETYGLSAPLQTWRTLREQIKADILANGLHEQGFFVRCYGDDQVDASLLMLPLIGFLPADDPRVIATVEQIERHFRTAEGFVYRNPIGDFAGQEGAFLLCSYWLADYYHIAGREPEAVALFEHLLDIRNDLGLLSEEYDPHQKRLLGNFPQSFSHLSLVKSALLIGAGESVEFSGNAKLK